MLNLVVSWMQPERSDPSVEVLVEVGSRIETGLTCCIMQAMKMENDVNANYSGINESNAVNQGQELLSIPVKKLS